MNLTKIIVITFLTSWIIFLWWCTQTQEKVNQPTQDVTVVAISEYAVDPSDMVDATTLITPIAGSELSDFEKTGLIQMREEEKLARDVYMTLWAQRGKQIFGNIAQSEQTHTDAIKILLDRYSIADPVTSDAVGVFTSPVMQQLYTDLVQKGSTSLLDALIIGATVEDLDIKDLEELINTTDNQDIIAVYNNLNKWSRNHLRAYVKNITTEWWSYTPQYIPQSLYDSILASAQERGNASGWWMGNGIGRWNR